MNQFTLTLLIFSTSMLFSSCAMNRAKSQKMLEERAAYQNGTPRLQKLKNGVSPIQKPARRSRVYVYPHQLPNGDYFLGGYIFAEVEKEKILLDGGLK